MQQRLSALVFSKDRALQLCAALESFYTRCIDADCFPLTVLYTTSDSAHQAQYDTLQSLFPRVHFLKEDNFKLQLLAELTAEHVLFLVDDVVFTAPFSLEEVLSALDAHSAALCCSLRLGENTRYCYPLNRPQEVPEFSPVTDTLVSLRWVEGDGDFGYPCDVSSSVYRVHDIRELLQELPVTSPNFLEANLAASQSRFVEHRPELLCFRNSVAFCNPLNRVQQDFPENRAGDAASYTSQALQEAFTAGKRIDVRAYLGYLPSGAHEEAELSWTELPRHSSSLSRTPLVSVIIPCFQQAGFLREAIESILRQSYPHWELVIVNEGGTPDTNYIVREVMQQHPWCKVTVIDQEHAGVAHARNVAVRAAAADWIYPLDADDKLSSIALEELIAKALTTPGCNLVTPYMRCFGRQDDLWAPDPIDPEKIRYGNSVPYASLFHRSLWEKSGGYPAALPYGAEDWSFWIGASPYIRQAIVRQELFFYRREHRVSATDRVEANRPVIEACLRTLHYGLYPIEEVLTAHQTLSEMQDGFYQEICKKIVLFPELPHPYFWRGLYYEKIGRTEQALRDYQTAITMSVEGDWQAPLRLMLLAEKLGRDEIAAEARNLLECSISSSDVLRLVAAPQAA